MPSGEEKKRKKNVLSSLKEEKKEKGGPSHEERKSRITTFRWRKGTGRRDERRWGGGIV